MMLHSPNNISVTHLIYHSRSKKRIIMYTTIYKVEDGHLSGQGLS